MQRTTNTRPLAPTTALDHALDALAAEDAESALRWSIPALSDEGSGAVALDLVARGLQALGENALSVDAYRLAADALSRQGLAPHAIAAAISLRTLTGETTMIAEIARAFGADAQHANAPKPPALASDAVRPIEPGVTRRQLVDQAAKAIRTARMPLVQPRPSLPLWGALPTVAFERFIAALQVRVCVPNQVLMTEGEHGEWAMVIARGELRVTRRDADAAEPIELAILGPGSIVGEMALVADAPRFATVSATRAALVLEAPRQALDRAAAEVPALGKQVVAFCHRRLVENVMRTSAILREVPASEREGLAQLFETRTYEPGESLIAEGTTGAGLHLIAAGRVEVRRTDTNGEPLRLATLGPGTCVGEISLVLRRPATASVVAEHPTISLVLPAERFKEVVKARPMLLARLYELAVEREDETLSVVAQEAVELDDAVII